MYLYENDVVFFVLLVEMIVTLLFLAMQQWGYSKMLRECEKDAKNNLVVKNIREGRVNVSSVDNFVNKYVNNFEFCGLKLYTIKKICGQLLNFVFITWAIVSIYGVYLEVSIKDLLWTTMLGILIVGGLFSMGHSVDNSKYEHIAKVNLKNIIEDFIYFSDEGMGVNGELAVYANSDVALRGVNSEGISGTERVNEAYSGQVEESIPRVEGEEIITTVGEVWKSDVFNTNSWDEDEVPSVASVYGTAEKNDIIYGEIDRKNARPVYEAIDRKSVRSSDRDIDEAIAETRRRREGKERDMKVSQTPEEKRMKLRKAVFATDKNPARGSYVVELNSDNLGYLSDYQ